MADTFLNGMDPSQAAAEAQRAFEQTQNHNINTLSNIATVQDKDGKSYWLGIEVAPELSSTLKYMTSIAPTYISGFLRNGVYDHSSKIFNKLNDEFKLTESQHAGHKAGLAAAAAMSTVLIGLQPAMEVVHGFRQRSKERKDIRTAMASIVGDNKGAYENNEVIKTAIERTNETLNAGIKQAAAELPTVLLNGYYAVGSHKELVKQKTSEYENKIASDTSANGMSSKVEERLKRQDDNKKARDEFVERMTSKGRSKEQIEEAWRAEENEQREIERHKEKAKYQQDNNSHSNNNGLIETPAKTLAVLGAGAVNNLIKSNLTKDDGKDANKCAYQLIVDLQERVINGDISEGSDITSQIVEIFQQNEKDRGRSGIGPALMEKFEPLAKRIGEVISRKELDPLALVTLVGDGKVMNKRHFVPEAKLEEILDAQRKVFSSHEKTPLDEFLADFQNPQVIMGAITENLKTLEGREKAVFASLFSDEVLAKAGIDKKEIPALRTAGHDAMCEFVKSSTVELAKKTTEELKAQGLSQQQIDAINELNEFISAGNDKEIKSAIDRADGVTGAVRNARLEEQLKKGAGKGGKAFWTEIIGKKAPVLVAPKEDMSKAETVQTERERNERESGAEVGGMA